jgi:hypothetical protein
MCQMLVPKRRTIRKFNFFTCTPEKSFSKSDILDRILEMQTSSLIASEFEIFATV